VSKGSIGARKPLIRKMTEASGETQPDAFRRNGLKPAEIKAYRTTRSALG